jgi:hypothetical protein
MAKQLVPAPDIKETAMALKEGYPGILEDVNLDRILFWRDLAEKKGKVKTFAYLQKVNDMDRRVNPNHDYHLVVNGCHFDKMVPAAQNITVFHELHHVKKGPMNDDGVEEAQLRDHDVKDFWIFLATFGVDWATNPLVRDPLGEDVVFEEKPKDEEEPDATGQGQEQDPQFV